MAINSIDFTGQYDGNKYANPILSMQQMNKWREHNLDVKLINIESVSEYVPLTTMDDVPFERQFLSIRVWFEN